MDKRPSARRFDYLGADTYGWPLPARQDTNPRRPGRSRREVEKSGPAPGRTALVMTLDKRRDDSLSVLLPGESARAYAAASTEKMAPPPAPLADGYGGAGPRDDNPVETASDIAAGRAAVSDAGTPMAASHGAGGTPFGGMPALLAAPGELLIEEPLSELPTIAAAPGELLIEEPLSELSTIAAAPGELLVEGPLAEMPGVEAAPYEGEALRPIRQQAPSPFISQPPYSPPQRRRGDIWADGNQSMFEDWRRVLRAATPAQNLLQSTGPAPDYPPIAVERRDEQAGRQVLRLYAGERSAITLAQTYAYYSICFEEDSQRLAPLMSRLAGETQILATTLGKLALAFGVDPRPRVLMAQRSQYWSGSYVRCQRNPRRALLDLAELERMLMTEIRRFLRQNNDTGAAALLARSLADAERRADTLNQAVSVGFG